MMNPSHRKGIPTMKNTAINYFNKNSNMSSNMCCRMFLLWAEYGDETFDLFSVRFDGKRC